MVVHNEDNPFIVDVFIPHSLKDVQEAVVGNPSMLLVGDLRIDSERSVNLIVDRTVPWFYLAPEQPLGCVPAQTQNAQQSC